VSGFPKDSRRTRAMNDEARTVAGWFRRKLRPRFVRSPLVLAGTPGLCKLGRIVIRVPFGPQDAPSRAGQRALPRG
jgi:hypothetical protein